jgi:hypothetical protein
MPTGIRLSAVAARSIPAVDIIYAEAAVRRLHPSNGKPYRDSTGPNLEARFLSGKVAIADLKKFREVTLPENSKPSPVCFFSKASNPCESMVRRDNRIFIYFFYYLKTHAKR